MRVIVPLKKKLLTSTKSLYWEIVGFTADISYICKGKKSRDFNIFCKGQDIKQITPFNYCTERRMHKERIEIKATIRVVKSCKLGVYLHYIRDHS